MAAESLKNRKSAKPSAKSNNSGGGIGGSQSDDDDFWMWNNQKIDTEC